MKTRHAIAALLALACMLACSEPASGPVRIVWGRHACDHCAMAISDPRYAAQIRTGPHDVMRFDDFGCALAWLEVNGGIERAQEFWVMDAQPDRWLDARRAFYRGGQRTPMAYGWAAVAEAAPDAVDFDAARRAILEQQSRRGSHGR